MDSRGTRKTQQYKMCNRIFQKDERVLVTLQTAYRRINKREL
jgi:hypothetical protein